MEERVRKRRSHICNLFSVLLNFRVLTGAQEGKKVDRVRCLCTGCFFLTVARLSHNFHMNSGSLLHRVPVRLFALRIICSAVAQSSSRYDE